MKTVKESVFLLTVTPYRDSDLVVNLLSSENGKLSALIYRGRRIGNANSFLYQPGDLLDIDYITRENDEFIRISNISGKSTLDTTAFSYRRFLFHSYLLELITRISQPGNPSEDLFEVLLENNTWLWRKETCLFYMGRFIWLLAQHGGFGIDYHRCENCGKPSWRYNDQHEAVFRRENYRFQQNSGVLLCHSCVPLTKQEDTITPAMLKVMWMMESSRRDIEEILAIPENIMIDVIYCLNRHLLHRFDIRPRSLSLYLESLKRQE